MREQFRLHANRMKPAIKRHSKSQIKQAKETKILEQQYQNILHKNNQTLILIDQPMLSLSQTLEGP